VEATNVTHVGIRPYKTLSAPSGTVLLKLDFSPDGKFLAAAAADQMVRIWDLSTGQMIGGLKHPASVTCISWSPNGELLATGGGSGDHVVRVWDLTNKKVVRFLRGHFGIVRDLSWSPDGKRLASCADDGQLRMSEVTDARESVALGATSRSLNGLAWLPDSTTLLFGSENGVAIWSLPQLTWTMLRGHDAAVRCVAWLEDGCASGSDDQTVRIWDPKTRRVKYVLQGHTSAVVSIQSLADGHLLFALGEDGTLIAWCTDDGSELLRIENIALSGPLANIASHASHLLIAMRGPSRQQINTWELDLDALQSASADSRNVHYVNAKVVLLGDSGVGKSALGARIAEGSFRPTKSTHGAQFWHFPAEQLPGLPKHIEGELTLWDLAGQPEYRLTHQLFLNDADAALLLFDCSDVNDPFHGIHYWAKVLKKVAPAHSVKFLVSARCDVSPVTVSRGEINIVLGKYALDDYFKTSANTGEGIRQLFEHLITDIPWDDLPQTSTPRLFHEVREYLLECKAAGKELIKLDEVRQVAQKNLRARATEIDTVIRLLQSGGLIARIDPRPGLSFVLLRPELINKYGSSIIQAARNHPNDIGAITERSILTGGVKFVGFERLSPVDEAFVLEATMELLVARDLCFREMGYLVFPSQINVTRTLPAESRPRTEVTYRFSGAIETIYASLVVRLNYTEYFRRVDQWKYAVEFSRNGIRLGFSMHQIEEGTGELQIYFHEGISEFDRVTFTRFVTEHLRVKGIDIQEEIPLYCGHCGKEVTNRDAIKMRIQNELLDIPCQYCGTAILIPQSIEERYSRDQNLVIKQRELVRVVDSRTEQEITQFAADREQYTQSEGPEIQILHLSDLHVTDEQRARLYRSQLETDLIQELGVQRLDYFIISGDIGQYSTEAEYQIAFDMVDGIVKRFALSSERVIIVPGNHDLNWELSEESYPFVPKRKLPSVLSDDRCIPAGDMGMLVRDDRLYPNRFKNFNEHFYKHIYVGKEYPLDYAEQTIFFERPEENILFVALNSSWEIDHHFRKRAGINSDALTRLMNRLNNGEYDGWLKIAVWHHPVSGKEMMNDDFMGLLSVHKFQICVHGHIHEAIEGFYKYDEQRGINIIGAGAFSAPPAEQVTGIPLQYNLFTFDPRSAQFKVETRKKERLEGPWSADARWGDKRNPRAWYTFKVRDYRPPDLKLQS
jgi:small GTP-binding protein